MDEVDEPKVFDLVRVCDADSRREKGLWNRPGGWTGADGWRWSEVVDCGLRNEGRDGESGEKKSLVELELKLLSLLLLLLMSLNGAGNLNRALAEAGCSLIVVRALGILVGVDGRWALPTVVGMLPEGRCD